MATKAKSKVIKHEARVTRVVRDAAYETSAKIIACLEAGTVPWHKDWVGTTGLPTSLSTGRPYGGSNVLVLWITAQERGFSSLYWGTYNQIKARGGQVRKGEKSVEIIRPITIVKKDQKLAEGETPKTFSVLRLFHVFNVDQADWAEDAKLPKVIQRTPVEAIEAAEALIAEYLDGGPSLGHGGDKAFYRPAADHIQMPERDSFTTAEGYYSTLYHEATHSTGHDSRWKNSDKTMGRVGIAEGTFGPFGSPVYSNEELVAELGAAMLCAIAGIEQKATLDNSAAYLAHWIAKLKGDKNLIVQAASAAQRAVNLIMSNLPADTEEEES